MEPTVPPHGVDILAGMAPDPLCLLAVHAHPDDESSKGAGTVAKYHAEGVRTVLVCCTGGEAGDILNPAMDRPEVKDDLPAVRRAELDRAAAIIGYDEVVMLGYRDSGMPDSDANAHPLSFAQAPMDEAVERLVGVLRRTRPQVVVTYGDEQGGYPHPDHLRVHDITQPAVDRAADPDWYPAAGDPWQVAKIYYTVWSRKRIELTHAKFVELGIESPYSEEWFKRPWQDHRITTSIGIDGFAQVRYEALLAHATQIDPESPFWFGLPRDVAVGIHPYDEYIRAMSLVDAPTPERDLFAGLRAEVNA
jgi:mycothiol S-conjugate amidase